METILNTYYEKFYLGTNGYMPTNPVTEIIYPGDFFQIINGKIQRLGNIYKEDLVEKIRISEAVQLSAYRWQISSGLHKEFSIKEMTNETSQPYMKQILRFQDAGSFAFRANEPEMIKISNWDHISDELIVKLTQSKYGFRELYLATEIVTAKQWTLAISGRRDAELELVSDSENASLVDIFGVKGTKAIQSKGIDIYENKSGRTPNFFKAKKLVIRDDKQGVGFDRILKAENEIHGWAKEFYDYSFDLDPPFIGQHHSEYFLTNAIDMLVGTAVDIKNALEHYKWVDASLDDVMKYHLTHV